MLNWKRILRDILITLFMIISIGLFVFMIVISQQKEKEESDFAEALNKETRPYRVEFNKLKDNLKALKKDTVYTSENANIMVGFRMADSYNIGDISYIRELAKKHQLKPIIIIDCANDMEAIKSWLEVIDTEWEIMLGASTFSSEVNEKVLSVKSYLETIDRKDVGIFFLQRNDTTNENIGLLKQDGFYGYTNYHEYPEFGQNEDESIYFDYSFIQADNTEISTRLGNCYQTKETMIFIFNMEKVISGELSKDSISSNLTSLSYYSEKEDCRFSTVAEVVEELSQINQIKAEKKADYEKQVSIIQERIEELEKIIEEIYEKRDGKILR